MFDDFFDAYLTCALWSSHDISEDGDTNPLDEDFSTDDIADEALASLKSEARDFLDMVTEQFPDFDELSAEQMGHDFWLTRNGHGAGFWDRGLGEVGDELSKIAKSFGSRYLYVGNDGKIYAQ